jgi:hypothetical protein
MRERKKKGHPCGGIDRKAPGSLASCNPPWQDLGHVYMKDTNEACAFLSIPPHGCTLPALIFSPESTAGIDYDESELRSLSASSLASACIRHCC